MARSGILVLQEIILCHRRNALTPRPYERLQSEAVCIDLTIPDYFDITSDTT